MKQIITILFAILLLSCGSKKKVVNRDKIKEVSEASFEVKKTISESLDLEIVEESASVELNIDESEVLEVEADSSGVVTVEVVKTAVGYKKTFTGVKSVRVVNERQETEKVDTTSLISRIKAETESFKEESSSIKIKSEKNGRNTEVEIQSKSTEFWIMLFFIILVFLIWRILRKKVGWLP